jgi:hypothetical protein
MSTSDIHAGSSHADSWHHHGPEEGAPQPEHGRLVDPAVMFQVFVVIFGFTGVFVLATVLYFNVSIRQEKEKRVETIANASGYNQMKGAMEAELASYGVVDPAAKVVRIPIDRAVDRVVSKYQAKK